MFESFNAWFHCLLNPPRPKGVEDVPGAAFRIWARPTWDCDWMIASFDGVEATLRVSSETLEWFWDKLPLLKASKGKLTPERIHKLQSHPDPRVHLFPAIHQSHFNLGSWRRDWSHALEPEEIQKGFTFDGAVLDGTTFGIDVMLKNGAWFEMSNHFFHRCAPADAIAALVDLAQPSIAVEISKSGLRQPTDDGTLN